MYNVNAANPLSTEINIASKDVRTVVIVYKEIYGHIQFKMILL